VKSKTAAKLKKALSTKQFDAGLREETVAFSLEAETVGETATDTARRLGMKPNTLQRWRQRARKTAPAVSFVEVEAVPLFEGLEVVWPTGHLIRVGTGDLKSVFSALEATCCPRE
jgi:hypothetical protein